MRTRLRYGPDTAWMADAACVGHSALPWTEDLQRVPEVLVEIMADLCATCLVRDACAAYVVEAGIVAGWWAGVNLNGFEAGYPPTTADMRSPAGVRGGSPSARADVRGRLRGDAA